MKLSGHQQVMEFLRKLEHPQKAEIEEVRQIILSADNRLTEHVKWNAPSFCMRNEDRITFNLRGKGYFQLIFHYGAKVRETPAKEPLFEDATGMLDWITGDRAVIKFTDGNDVQAKKEKLAEVVAKWMEATPVAE